MGSSTVKMLNDAGAFKKEVPRFIPTNMHYEVITGSVAYGTSGDASDMDIVGFCIPPKDEIFPHLRGEIIGFGRQKKRFDNWQEHHIDYKDKQYDITVYSIVRFFSLCMEMNPNMVDCLFVPNNCVIHATQVGQMVREKRHIFLSKACWPKFKGYAYSQLKKMKNKNPEGLDKILEFECAHKILHSTTLNNIQYEIDVRLSGSSVLAESPYPNLDYLQLCEYRDLMKNTGNRAMDVKLHGMDCKFGMHVVRLLDEVQQILTLGDLDIQRDRERLKAIRRGEWTVEQVEDFFTAQEKNLEAIYNESKLPWGPDEDKIKQLLLDCLESHYGSLEKAIVIEGKEKIALREIHDICEKLGV